MAQAASTYLGEQRRRSTRLDQTVPLIIRGVDLLGQPFEERTSAQNLNLNGCRYSSKHHLPKNTWVTLEIPAGHAQKGPLCVRVRVAWIQRPKTLRELFQVGVELEAAGNIWGIAPAPTDWTGDAASSGREPGPIIVQSDAMESESKGARIGGLQAVKIERPLDSYLEGALAKSAADAEANASLDESPLFRELQRQIEGHSRDILKEAMAASERMVSERTEALEARQSAAAEAFYQTWQAEFQRGAARAHEEISTRLDEELTAGLARLNQELQADLDAKLARTALSEWSDHLAALREEARSFSMSAAARAEENFDAKLACEIESLRQELTSKASQAGAAVSSESPQDAPRFEAVRAQWNELIETSLDGAGQRLAARLAENAQEVFRGSEQKLAARLAELQTESGLSVEAACAALEEMRNSLGTEIARAKESLSKMEQAATHFADYSQRLEAVNQDSLKELNRRLDAGSASRVAQMEKRATEIEGQLAGRLAELAAQATNQSASDAVREAESKIQRAIERAEEGAQQVSVRQQQAEELLHIHRERLRQAAEQSTREAGESMRAAMAYLQSEFEKTRADAAGQWESGLNASAEKLSEAVLAAFADKASACADAQGARLHGVITDALHRVEDQLAEMTSAKSRDFDGCIEAAAASHLQRMRESADILVQERLESARGDFARAAEEAAGNFGASIQAASDETIAEFSSACQSRAKEHEAALNGAVERAAEDMNSLARNSQLRFEDQLIQTTSKTSEQLAQTLASQLAESAAEFQKRSEAHWADLEARQEQLGREASDRHSEQLREATRVLVDSAVREIDILGQNRTHSLLRIAEGNVRRACAEIFEALSHSMREVSEAASDPPPEVLPPLHDAGAEQRPAV